jgi:hypothetical protein
MAVSGVGEDHVDAVQLGKRAIDRRSHRVVIGDVQRGRPERVAVAFGEICETLRIPCGGRDAVSVA